MNEKTKKYRIELQYDYDTMSPREWDNVGTMACFHWRYKLGDKHKIDASDFSGWDEIERHLIKEEGAILVLPLYLYDHSGMTMNTTGFSCVWDSGQVGFIYATEKGLTEFGGDREKLEQRLLCEVKTYDQYLRGEVYGYSVEEKTPPCECCGRSGGWEVIDSCGGFIGTDYFKEEVAELLKQYPDAEIVGNTAELFQ